MTPVRTLTRSMQDAAQQRSQTAALPPGDQRMPFAKLSSCRRWTTWTCILALSACSTAPVVTWRRDDGAVSGRDMPQAMQYLQTARNAYRGAVAQQMADESGLATMLVGTGALVALLAAGGAHRDAILGATAIGGTAYAFGNMNLRRTRVLTYQAGVEALNCAQRAVIPFDMPADELAALSRDLDQLEGSRARLNAARHGADQVRGLTSGNDRARLDQAIALADEVAQSAARSLRAGREFAGASRRASRELVAAVDRIDAAVVRSVIDTTPDLSNVPKVIGGLAGMMGSFAPGAGLDNVLATALSGAAARSNAITAKSAAGQQPTRVDQEVRALSDATIETGNLVGAVNARLAGRATAWPEDAFRDCGVTQVVSALSVDPASLAFAPGVARTRSIEIAGGVKPYFVELDGGPIDGISLKPPLRFDSRAEVSVSSTVTGTHALSLRVLDSSPTARSISVPVTVAPPAAAPAPAANASAAKPGAAAPKPAKPAAPAAGTGMSQAAQALQNKGQFTFGGKPYVIVAVGPASGTVLPIQVNCPAGASAATQAQLGAALVAEAGIPKPKGWSLRFAAVGGGNCVAP